MIIFISKDSGGEWRLEQALLGGDLLSDVTMGALQAHSLGHCRAAAAAMASAFLRGIEGLGQGIGSDPNHPGLWASSLVPMPQVPLIGH